MRRLARWTARGSWAVADQAFVSLANFSLSVLLARWLAPADYGGFAVAFSAYLLLTAVHRALWIEPMLVYGSGRYRESFAGYFVPVLRSHWLFAAGSLAVFLATAAIFAGLDRPALMRAFAGIALAAPGTLLLLLARRACYVHLNPRLATAGGATYLGVVLAGLSALHRADLLAVETAMLVAGAAGLLAGGWLLRRLAVSRPAAPPVATREVLDVHWRFSRWILLANAFSWTPELYYWVLPAGRSLGASAELKALMNLTLPPQHFIAALGSLVLPTLVRAREGGRLGPTTRTALVLFGALGCGCWLALGLGGPWLVDGLYAGRYAEHAHWLWWLGLLPLSAAVVAVLGSAIRALERPRWIAGVYAAVAVGTLAAGVPLALRHGIAGVVAGQLLVAVVRIGGMGAFFVVERRSGAGR